MADRFGISLRTVYRDIQSLEESGCPSSERQGWGIAWPTVIGCPCTIYPVRSGSLNGGR
ncbi:MAG: helix-turn-helix domain-containing protein [Saprospiraceae bacterium]|nr:helix-turn-helix domain-containing protein [Saprospiraceae bacterium]